MLLEKITQETVKLYSHNIKWLMKVSQLKKKTLKVLSESNSGSP
jgi:hypothetical protein